MSTRLQTGLNTGLNAGLDRGDGGLQPGLRGKRLGGVRTGLGSRRLAFPGASFGAVLHRILLGTVPGRSAVTAGGSSRSRRAHEPPVRRHFG